MTLWLELTAPSPLAVLCSCPSPSLVVRPRQRGSVMMKISRHHSLGGALCPWLLFSWYIGVVGHLCTKQSLSFSSPGQWKTEILFKVNLRRISLLLICSNYQCAKRVVLPNYRLIVAFYLFVITTQLVKSTRDILQIKN